MRDDDFRTWMQSLGTMSSGPISDARSRCKRLERCFKTDLDDEYAKDGGRNLVAILAYSKEDEQRHRPAPNEIDFKPGTNIKPSMDSLKAAAAKYFEFCRVK